MLIMIKMILLIITIMITVRLIVIVRIIVIIVVAVVVVVVAVVIRIPGSCRWSAGPTRCPRGPGPPRSPPYTNSLSMIIA